MLKFETQAIQSTIMEDKNAGAVTPPIYLSTTFEREPDGSHPYGYIYSRMDNPNRQLLEKSMAILEHGSIAFAFSSGMAATAAVFQSLKSGEHIILPHDAYYSTELLARNIFERWGLEASKVDMTSTENIKNNIRENTALIWVETPSNPMLKISDIDEIIAVAHGAGALCAVDNTWATPVIQNPLNLGADIVMHSNTKYIGGHCDVLGGTLVLKEKGKLAQKIKEIQELSGGVPSPFECWLITRGIRTLAVRLKTQTANAQSLAEHLNQHPGIETVHYPGLTSHPNHQIAKKQMHNGFGAMLSVQVKGSAAEAMALTGKLKLFTTATSLGGVESLVEHRKSVEGDNSQTPENLLRISVGLENIEDLISDWDTALAGL